MTGKLMLLAVTALAGGIALSAAEEPVIRKMTVEADMTAPPDVSYRNHSAFSPKNPSTSKWLMLKIEYTPELSRNFVPEYRLRKGGPAVTFPGWLDDVKLQARVLFETGILTKGGKPVLGLFTGDTVFQSIKRDGSKHLALMFVPARLLDRYCVPGGRNVGKNFFHVEVMMSAKGKVLASAYCNVPGTTPAEKKQSFDQMLKGVPKQLDIRDAVLSRARSPWALLAPDNFDWEDNRKSEETNGSEAGGPLP